MATVQDDEAGGKGPRRRYDASGRRRRAAESRRRIIEAAADLFSEQGYATTTLDQIAQRAGVTTKLVVANGPKRNLLLAAFEQRFAGVENPGTEGARASAAEILSEPVPDVIVAKLTEFAVAGQERGIGMWRAFSAAADADPDVREIYLQVAEGRRAATRVGIDLLAEEGLLRPGDRDRQTATLALLMGFDPYQLAVQDWGWSREELSDWLAGVIAATIVDTAPAD